MLADPLTIPAATPTAGSGSGVTFTTTEFAGKSSTRLNTATSLSAPETLVIKHQTTGPDKNLVVRDRHLISSSRVETDTDGKPYACTVNLTFDVPRNGLFSDADVLRQLSILANLLTSTSGEYLTKILQNQV